MINWDKVNRARAIYRRWMDKHPNPESLEATQAAERIVKGICPTCGKHPIAPDRDTCVDCSH